MTQRIFGPRGGVEQARIVNDYACTDLVGVELVDGQAGRFFMVSTGVALTDTQRLVVTKDDASISAVVIEDDVVL
jgi:hypothetical protein